MRRSARTLIDGSAARGRSRRRRALAAIGGAAGISLLVAALAWAAKGELSFQQRLPEFTVGNATGIAGSPDGKHLYVSGGNSLTVLSRDATTGEFAYVETETDGIDDPSDPGATVNGLQSTTGVAVSADGKNVYATGWQSDNAIAVFARDAATGKLNFVEVERDGVDDTSDPGAQVDFMFRPEAVAVAPDGKSVYAVSSSDDSVVGFTRDPADGKLSYLEAEVDGVNDAGDAGGTVDGMQSPSGVTVAPDSEAVYVATDSDDGLVAFQRDTATGRLSYAEFERDGIDDAGDAGGTVNGLNGATAVAVAPDNSVVFALGEFDSAIAVFERDAATEELSFIEAEVEGVDDAGDAGGTVAGLGFANELTLSPDGLSLYVAGANAAAVPVFRWVPGTDELAFIEAETNGVDDATDPGGTVTGLTRPTAVAVSSDGNHVYLAGTGDSGLALFDRAAPANPTLGKLSFRLSFPELSLSGPRGVAVAPDGKHVFVASLDDDSLRSFSRDPATGAVALVDTERQGVDDPSDAGGVVAGLEEPKAVTVSPDGAHVYVTDTSTYSISTYALDSATGELRYVESEIDAVDDLTDPGGTVTGLYEPWDVVVSPDGTSVYGLANNDNGISAFARNPATGKLSFVEAEFDGVGGVDGLAGAQALAISPDGNSVYAAGRNESAVTAFARNSATGALTFLEVERNGDDDPTDPGGPVDGLSSGPNDVVVAPDGKQVYFISSASIAGFDRDPATGKLSFAEVETDGVNDPTDPGGAVEGLSGGETLAISADGGELYAGASAITHSLLTFSRDRGTGKLSFLEVESQGADDPSDAGGRVAGLLGIEDLAVAPDDRHLYGVAEADDSLTIFARDDDFVAPDTTIASGPAEGSTTADPTPAFAITSNEASATFTCSVDGAAFVPCPAELAALADGAHSLAATATDAEGNVDPTPATRSFTVDTTAPDTAITAGPQGASANASPSFSFASPEPGARFECRLDAGGFSPCGSPKGFSSLSDGEHSFRVRAVDAVDNADASPALRSFSVDTKVDGATVEADDKQKQKGKKIKVKIKPKAEEATTATAAGSIEVGKKSYKLDKESADLAAGDGQKLKLKPKKSKHKRKIADALDAGKKVKAKITTTFTDALGNEVELKTTVKLKRK